MTPGTAPVLLTDLYQLTMLQAYHAAGMNDTAVFEFFVRRLPARRNFLLAAGLEQVLEMLEQLRFDRAELDWLRHQPRFDRGFVDSLAELRFSGDVDAMPEGTPFFADEPILRVVAPLREAQLIESRVINLLQYQTLVASKAARVRLAAGDALLVDFGMRRAHGAEAALLSARASWRPRTRSSRWPRDWRVTDCSSTACASTAATSASMPAACAPFSTPAAAARCASSPAATSTRTRCTRCARSARRSTATASARA
jgi:hypothetical protein